MAIVSEANYNTIHGERIKILITKQMLERLATVLAQVKADSTSENVLNEICQIIYFLYQGKEITEKLYKNVMNLGQL